VVSGEDCVEMFTGRLLGFPGANEVDRGVFARQEICS
jgi:hypothetical protein